MDVTSYLLGKKNGGTAPTGTINITSNGETNVTNYATANVNVEDTRWQEIGYSSEPTSIQDGIDYAKDIMNDWDATITDRTQAFKDDKLLKYFPSVDTSKITNAGEMFRNSGVECVPDDLFAENQVVDTNGMFQYCYELKEVGDFKTTGKKQNMFEQCSSLKKVGTIYITNQSYYGYTFNNCSNLETIEGIVISNSVASLTTPMFSNCPKLSDATLKMILNFLKTIPNQSSSYKKLKSFGLSETQANKCITFDEWTPLSTDGWTTGY